MKGEQRTVLVEVPGIVVTLSLPEAKELKAALEIMIEKYDPSTESGSVTVVNRRKDTPHINTILGTAIRLFHILDESIENYEGEYDEEIESE